MSIILKFGGTSLATSSAREQVANKIIEAKKTYKDIVVVVSAIGRLGSPYATDSLLELVAPEYYITNKEKDLLMSCGEIISTIVMSNLLKKNGISCEALTGGEAGIVTTDDYTEAEFIEINLEYLNTLLEKDIIPIVAGFQGITKDGHITTIGRGGSDTTAAILGEALKSEQIQIYTDVDGIMTADPRVCSEARTIKEISYHEVFQMADSGAKVIHPRAVEIARRSGIPLIIKNTFSLSKGTNVSNLYTTLNTMTKDKLITGIAHRNNRIQFSIYSETIDDEKFFSDLANNSVSIDIINIFPTQKIFTIDEKCKNKVLKLIKDYKLEYKIIENCSKVTIIGERMTGVPGVMARIIRCLKEKDIKILQTADSLSTIACLVLSKDLNKAVEALHKEFGLKE